jgi:hypothetical protein
VTPEQWLNVAECARRRWDVRVELRLANRIRPEQMNSRAGEFESWQCALERAGRVPF